MPPSLCVASHLRESHTDKPKCTAATDFIVRVVLPLVLRFAPRRHHAGFQVGDGEVEYKNVSIEGPNGVIRSSSMGVNNEGSPEGIMFVGCVRDRGDDRVLSNMYRTYDLTPDVSPPITMSILYFTGGLS